LTDPTATPLAAIHIDIDPVAFHLGPLGVHWYGLMYVVAITIGAMVAVRFARTLRADATQLEDLLPWGIGAGVLGGRLFFVVQNRQLYYLQHPQDIFAFWQGGMAFFGGIGAALISVFVFARARHISPWPLLDVAAIFAAVGQPFGRIGNVINGDIVGYPTHLPWGFVYENAHTLAPEIGVAYQPAPAYEILANLLLIAFLLFVVTRSPRPGVVAALYLAGYSVTQFAVFFWRDNSITALGLKQAQLTSIVTLAASLALLWWLNRYPRPIPPLPGSTIPTTPPAGANLSTPRT
jgi:phosphatidylglycerol---prolipoprotein diacylglyceryl transferase